MVDDPSLIQQLTRQKDEAYLERNLVLALALKLATVCGLKVELWRHEGEGWEDEWRNIVAIYLPTGQCSWHIHDSELPNFRFFPEAPNNWDGHTTEEKYQRLRDFLNLQKTLVVTDTLSL